MKTLAAGLAAESATVLAGSKLPSVSLSAKWGITSGSEVWWFVSVWQGHHLGDKSLFGLNSFLDLPVRGYHDYILEVERHTLKGQLYHSLGLSPRQHPSASWLCVQHDHLSQALTTMMDRAPLNHETD